MPEDFISYMRSLTAQPIQFYTCFISFTEADSYTCADAESEITACSGPVPSGAALDTSSVGTKTFTVTATDAAGNTSTASVAYRVTYAVALLYNPANANNANAQVKIKIQLRDAFGANVSAPNVAVAAVRVEPAGSPGVAVRQESGAFAYDATLAYQGSPVGGYTYKLDSAGLAPGHYELVFAAAGDPALHSAPFRLN